MTRDSMTARRPRASTLFAVALLTALLAVLAIGLVTRGDDSGPSAAERCEAEVERAAAVDPMQDDVDDLDMAIRRCASVAQFERAIARYAGSLGLAGSGREWATNRCEFEPSLRTTDICEELGY